jgi:MFS transporter, DHA1 family, tetracycline resistance protein
MKLTMPVLFILITVVLDAMGIGLIMPVMPNLIQEVAGGDLSSAAVWGGILATSFAVMQFLFGPTLGSISDRFGRRPVLLAALLVMAGDYLVMAVAGTIWLLLVGRIVGGITAATQSTASAYMADISKPEEKAGNFGLIGAAFGIGFVLGPLIGGLLAGFDTRAPFYVAAALALANMTFGYFALPETVTDRIRRPFEWRRANPIGAFRNIGALPGLGRLLLISFIYAIAFFVYPAIWAYFGQERFGWGPGMVGISLAAFGLAMAIVQGTLIRPMIRVLGERGTVIFGMAVDVVSFVILAFIANGTLALMLTPLTALGSVTGPAIQGIMSRTAQDNQQGELLGTLTSVSAVAVIIAPLLMTQTFWFFTSAKAPFILPGAPFLLSAVLLVICMVIFIGQRSPAALSGNRP